MASTVTINHEFDNFRFGTLNLGSSYATGGVAITGAQLDCPEKIVELVVHHAGGYEFQHIPSTGKIKAYSNFATYTATYDPASLAATTARDDAITVTGVAATDIVVGYQAAPALTSGLSIQEVRVSAANTITVRLNNASAGAIDGASGTWTFYVCSANGVGKEIASGVDLSAVNPQFIAFGY
jgi:hypothetical protein